MFPGQNKNVTYVFELPKWNKLDYVSHGSFSGQRAQTAIVAVQELHGGEVGSPDSYNDDGHWQARGVDDGVAGLVHVGDHPVSDDQQNKVLLHEDEEKTTQAEELDS